MTTTHPIRVANTAATTKLDPVTLEALVKRTLFVLSPSEVLSDITQASGDIALAVARDGGVFFYDSADSTTVDDGVTCLVDGSGHRYKLENLTELQLSSAISETNTPPGSPTVGDTYIVGTVPTGAWSAHAKAIAHYTRRGWVYETPKVGRSLLNKATDLNVQYVEAAIWSAFAIAIADGSLTPVMAAFPMGLPVESTTNTPPGSPTVGLYYIVGSAPTGAWSGQAGKVATYFNSAWVFLTPYDGARVYDRSLNYDLIYDTGVWAGAGGADVQEFTTPGAATWTKPSKGAMAFVQVWGAGGSGGRATTDETGGGGGGGAYIERWFKLSDLGATETATVGAGGASRTTNSNGAAGGNSTFGSWLTAYGGGGGGGINSNASAGGASVFGGAGGAGSFDSTNATAGTQPGGGGGGSETGNSGKGGDGKIRVTVV